MNNEIDYAKLELEKWLSDPHELGHKPYIIEYTNSFEDNDEIKCMIFKYKKASSGDWLLGIVSDSGTWSDMKKYNKDTEIEDAKIILETLKNFWKQIAKEIQ